MPASGVTKRSIAAGFLSEIQIRPSGPTLCGATVKSDRKDTKRTQQSVLINALLGVQIIALCLEKDR